LRKLKLSPPGIVLAILCAMYFLYFVDRTNLAIAGPVMAKDLHLNSTQLGLVFGAFGIPFALLQPLGGAIGDRFGPRLTLTLCALIVCAATAWMGLAGGIVSLFSAKLLLGIDLVKSAEELEAAYDDELGVTAAFNLNILLHINRLLGSDFRPRDWQHKAVFNAAQSRVEMYLRARRDLTVTWPDGARMFASGAEIHTENSYKYSRASILDLLQRSGFGQVRCWSDADNRYLVCHARAT